MTRSNLINAAVGVLGVTGMSMLAAPAHAASVVQYPAACQSMYPDANCLNHGPGNPRRYYGLVSPMAYNYDGAGYPAYYGYEPAFAPEPVAAGLVGGAIDTAGAIVSAPFRALAPAPRYDAY